MLFSEQVNIYAKPKKVLFFLISLVCTIFIGSSNPDRINHPDDGPKPLTPSNALKSFQLPIGFRIELVASEPLINEPTSVCWDEKGRLYVSELHGYNLEGQLEIEDMNKNGVLDTVVQRVQATEKYKKAAEKGTYGTIKRLSDTNGDGIMDKVEIIADHISPVYGICAALGGLIVAGHADIIYILDKDDDGKADVIDTIFTGFKGGALERGINAPQWGPDGWIYFGQGWNSGRITGPNLKTPVNLPRSNFRIRADGSAIEPFTGNTHTIGHAFTADGDNFFTDTWKHALYAIPIQWKYLARNPDATISSLEANASDYSNVFPKAPVHPWKLARSNQAGWKELYGNMGLQDGASEGYFTSSCSPLVYQDNMFPKEFSGNLFVCEPAQGFIHRSIVEQDGTGLKVHRAANEQDKEFLTSTDSWFRPVSLASAPDGSLYVTDMYREIIEDYSAVPRFMQQKYGLKNGMKHGRIWRISVVSAKPIVSMNRVDMTNANLEKELESPHFWIRQTADRLIHEKYGIKSQSLLKRRVLLSKLESSTPQRNFVNALRTQDTILKTDVAAARRLAKLSYNITDQRMLLQLALSLGYSQDAQVYNELINFAKKHGNIRWMPDAILTGVHGREGIMLKSLLKDPGATGNLLLEPLAASISARRNGFDLETALIAITNSSSKRLQAISLKGINKNIKPFPLTSMGKSALNAMLESDDLAVKGQAIELAGKLNLGDSKELDAIWRKAVSDVANVSLSAEKRLAAIALLSSAPDELASKSLIVAWPTSTPLMKTMILDALISKGKRISQLVEALTNKVILVTALSPLQRTELLEKSGSLTRFKVEAEFAKANKTNDELVYTRYVKALDEKSDLEKGGILFSQICAGCHHVNDVGVTVGPDLKNSYNNAKATLLRSILFPSEKIASGYDTFIITTNDNDNYTGVLVAESPNSAVIRQAGGINRTFLRKDIKKMVTSPTSLMPAFGEAITPEDCANIIEWIKVSLTKK
jgi:putative membrane-bound dehydrogenase-like protein